MSKYVALYGAPRKPPPGQSRRGVSPRTEAWVNVDSENERLPCQPFPVQVSNPMAGIEAPAIETGERVVSRYRGSAELASAMVPPIPNLHANFSHFSRVCHHKKIIPKVVVAPVGAEGLQLTKTRGQDLPIPPDLYRPSFGVRPKRNRRPSQGAVAAKLLGHPNLTALRAPLEQSWWKGQEPDLPPQSYLSMTAGTAGVGSPSRTSSVAQMRPTRSPSRRPSVGGLSPKHSSRRPSVNLVPPSADPFSPEPVAVKFAPAPPVAQEAKENAADAAFAQAELRALGVETEKKAKKAPTIRSLNFLGFKPSDQDFVTLNTARAKKYTPREKKVALEERAHTHRERVKAAWVAHESQLANNKEKWEAHVAQVLEQQAKALSQTGKRVLNTTGLRSRFLERQEMWTTYVVHALLGRAILRAKQGVLDRRGRVADQHSETSRLLRMVVLLSLDNQRRLTLPLLHKVIYKRAVVHLSRTVLINRRCATNIVMHVLKRSRHSTKLNWLLNRFYSVLYRMQRRWRVIIKIKRARRQMIRDRFVEEERTAVLRQMKDAVRSLGPRKNIADNRMLSQTQTQLAICTELIAIAKLIGREPSIDEARAITEKYLAICTIPPLTREAILQERYAPIWRFYLDRVIHFVRCQTEMRHRRETALAWANRGKTLDSATERAQLLAQRSISLMLPRLFSPPEFPYERLETNVIKGWVEQSQRAMTATYEAHQALDSADKEEDEDSSAWLQKDRQIQPLPHGNLPNGETWVPVNVAARLLVKEVMRVHLPDRN
mmetsp:Transcript_41/g.114  ORF Transcript_41/g.114 Transcript_41/m.114 type:complete len:774 (+) Transcript_41:3-2324(+)